MENPYEFAREPLLIVISGPSGVGKDAVVRRLQERGLPFHFVITATDREPRPNEKHGVDYFFLTAAAFEEIGVTPGEYAENYSWNQGAVTVPTYDARTETGQVVINSNLSTVLGGISIMCVEGYQGDGERADPQEVVEDVRDLEGGVVGVGFGTDAQAVGEHRLANEAQHPREEEARRQQCGGGRHPPASGASTSLPSHADLIPRAEYGTFHRRGAAPRQRRSGDLPLTGPVPISRKT